MLYEVDEWGNWWNVDVMSMRIRRCCFVSRVYVSRWVMFDVQM